MLANLKFILPAIAVAFTITGCSGTQPTQSAKSAAVKSSKPKDIVPVVYEKRSPRKHRAPARKHRNHGYGFGNKLSNAALNRLKSRVRYEGSYVKIAYPWGDVPANIGVCTDVVIRSYRKLGIDLQSQVHRDMSAAFHTYPNYAKWGLSRPDTNIDHRRVYNLRNFFQRRGAALPVSRNPRNYKPGDLVTWMVGPDMPHIGIVVNKRSKADPNRYMIVHNIAHGPQMEDILFRFPITGHYRYTTAHMNNIPNVQYAGNSRQPVRNNTMSTHQLIAAANLLNSSSNRSSAKSTNTITTVAQSENNSAKELKAKNENLKLAKLSPTEVAFLLGK